MTKPRETGLRAIFARGEWVSYAGPIDWLIGRSGKVHSFDEDRGLIFVTLPGTLEPFGAFPANLVRTK